MTARTTNSSCYMCSLDCPITVKREGDRIVSVKHPECVRAEGMVEQRESPDRIITAMMRARHTDEWANVPIEQALSRTAEELMKIRDRHGPQAVVFAAGFTKEVRPYLKRLANAFGSPNYMTEGSCCFTATAVAALVTLGKGYGYFLGPSRRSCPESECRIVWSTNPAESLLDYDKHHLIVDAPTVPTIVVDPRLTSLSERAAIHLRPRPGTDGALALGMAHVIIENGLFDTQFIEKFAHGFDEYREYVAEFTPGETSEITGVPRQSIVDAALLYGKSRPAIITISPSSTTHHNNGVQNHRAILLLAALCGNLDVEGGNRAWTTMLAGKNISLAGQTPLADAKPMGADEHPTFVKSIGEAQGMRLPEKIESGEVKAVFSIGLNVMMWPNSKRMARALRALEFFSLSDFFPSPTADSATMFFPAATHLERQSLVISPYGQIQYRPVTFQPRGDAIGDTELVFAIAERMGLGDLFWDGDIRACFNERLEGVGMSLDEVPADGTPVDRTPQFGAERAYLSNGFGTPTGKVEFVSTQLESIGQPGLPVFNEPYWSPISTPEIARDYPLVLTSGGRSRNYMHSQGCFLSTMRDREPDPLAQVNPIDASERGLSDGDWVEICSPIGTVTMRAAVTEAVLPGVVHAVHSRVGHDINEIIPDDGLDPISGFPPFKSSLCEVRSRKTGPR